MVEPNSASHVVSSMARHSKHGGLCTGSRGSTGSCARRTRGKRLQCKTGEHGCNARQGLPNMPAQRGPHPTLMLGLLGSVSAFSPVSLRLAPAARLCLSTPLPGLALVAPRTAVAFACAEKSKSKDLVTEDMAVAAVERAEALWAEALAAREKANELSLEAEEISETTAKETEGMNEKLSGEGVKFSLSMIGDARVAMDTAIDAQKLISDAVAAAELADQLEEDAEIALQVSEEIIKEYEEDFPESA